MIGLLGQTGTLIARSQTGPEDEYGQPTWVTLEVPVRYHAQPRSGQELIGAASAGLTTWVGWFEPDTPVDTADALLGDNGLAFEFDGPGRPWYHPVTTAQWYIEADLTRIERPETEESSS